MTYFTLIIIILLLLLNYFLYKKNLINKPLSLIIFSMLLTYITFTFLIYYNNLSLGFTKGMLYGDFFNAHFCDEYKYYIDSDILLNHFKNGDFHLWLNKSLPIYEFVDMDNHPGYGNYNIFVIFLTLLKMLGIKSVIDLILIKLFVYIPTAILIYKISKLYLNEKFSFISVILFSLLPGYILTNSLLMRDNIIFLLLLIPIYYVLSQKIKLIPIITVFISFILLIEFRSYSLLVLIGTIVFLFKNTKKIITLKDIIYTLTIISGIYFLSTYNFQLKHSNTFFSFFQIKALQENIAINYGNGFNLLINLFYKTAIHIFVDPPFLRLLTSGSVYLFLLSVGNIIATLISIIFIPSYIFLAFKSKDKNKILLLKLTFYFTLLTSLIVMAKDSFIINRIALMWLPLFIIIIFILINKSIKSNDEI